MTGQNKFRVVYTIIIVGLIIVSANVAVILSNRYTDKKVEASEKKQKEYIDTTLMPMLDSIYTEVKKINE